jgi:hypothetical protein
MKARSIAVVFALLLTSIPIAHARSSPPPGVQALFDLSISFGPVHFHAPFPSDRVTVPDASQNTGLRVNLPFPLPDCSNQSVPTEPQCFGIYTLNLLDGFNVQARLSIPFSGPIDPNTASSKTVFLVSLGSTLAGGAKPGQVIGINQIVWEVAANTLHAESNDLLEQHSRYAVLVTNGIHDANGNPVQASDTFTNFRHDLLGQNEDPALKAYGQELTQALDTALNVAGIPAKSLVAASVFTTQSVTATLEKIRGQIKAAAPAPADFLIGPGGTRALFNFSDISEVVFNYQFAADGTTAPNPTSIVHFLNLCCSSAPVVQIAYGRYSSPSYLTPDVIIPAVGTKTGVPSLQGANQIYFDLVIPTGTKPINGWPVAIYGHGGPGTKDFELPLVAGVAAKHGIATILINAVGNGGGPLSTLDIQKTDGSTVTIPSGGRSFDQNGDGFIDLGEGSNTIGPIQAGLRDANQQTVADWMQLVREIQVGMDIDGDGKPDLDPSRIYDFGFSQGSNQGTIFAAVEPAVRSAVLTSAGGPIIDVLRLSPNDVAIYTSILASASPPLLNGPNGTFIDNTPLRNQPPVINNVPGAEAIQELNDGGAWVSQAGEPVPYAQHLRKESLAGMLAKSVIIQCGKGDKDLPNPLETALVRAGDLADRTTYFRNDLFFSVDPGIAVQPYYPHAFMVDVFDDPSATAVALAAQDQIGTFFASDGTTIINPDPSLFEVPIAGPLPEGLNYLF